MGVYHSNLLSDVVVWEFFSCSESRNLQVGFLRSVVMGFLFTNSAQLSLTFPEETPKQRSDFRRCRHLLLQVLYQKALLLSWEINARVKVAWPGHGGRSAVDLSSAALYITAVTKTLLP